jgi:D-alanyl-D-alanine carboxypeptidase/D-alanyl-D-alanine-endopeptidase (penicillin-binding protein 4)
MWARNETLHFVPASNLKLFTTAVSLLRLGPDYRYVTKVVAQGRIEGGVLHGSLIVRASGDPSISARFHPGGAVGVFLEWAEMLVAQGIKEIRGGVIVDESLFDTQYLGSGWFWDDEAFAYSAQISAFSVNDNCIEVGVTAGSNEGRPGMVEVTPGTSLVRVINETRTTGASRSSLGVRRQPGTNDIVVSGTISPQDGQKKFILTVHAPGLFGGTLLKEALTSKGIVVHGNTDIVNDGQKAPRNDERLLVSHVSPPLSTIISHVNKTSHNLPAELLFRTLGAVYYGKGTSLNGTRVMLETLERAGVIAEEVTIRDGSGLSRLSMVTPFQMVSLLEFMYHHPAFIYFYNSLPVAGADGTLSVRMVGTCAEGNVRAKTGFSTHTGSLSGYVRTKNGEMLAFSLLTNNNPHAPSEIRKLQDSFCVWLCGQGR